MKEKEVYFGQKLAFPLISAFLYTIIKVRQSKHENIHDNSPITSINSLLVEELQNLRSNICIHLKLSTKWNPVEQMANFVCHKIATHMSPQIYQGIKFSVEFLN